MKIQKVQFVPITGGWYCDDKAAFSSGEVEIDHYLARGKVRTDGFENVREVGQGICVMLHLDDGTVAIGEGTSVTYAGFAGRHPPFRFNQHIEALEQTLKPYLLQINPQEFFSSAKGLDELTFQGKYLHPAVLYAASQALLDAAAIINHSTKAEVIAETFNLQIDPSWQVRIGIQSGPDRYSAVDKAIYRRVGAFPHGLIKNVEKDLGQRGEKLIDYARWIINRLKEHDVEPEYRPAIHFDCYGTIGEAFNRDIEKMTDYIKRLAAVVSPLTLQVESPVEMASREDQIDILAHLRDALSKQVENVALIADEWCNTLEDIALFCQAGAVDMIQVKMPDLGNIVHSIEGVLLCKQHGIGAYLGGSCNETDLSARTAVNVAMATQADQILARPGMGVDEAVCITANEFARLRTLLKR